MEILILVTFKRVGLLSKLYLDMGAPRCAFFLWLSGHYAETLF